MGQVTGYDSWCAVPERQFFRKVTYIVGGNVFKFDFGKPVPAISNKLDHLQSGTFQ